MRCLEINNIYVVLGFVSIRYRGKSLWQWIYGEQEVSSVFRLNKVSESGCSGNWMQHTAGKLSINILAYAIYIFFICLGLLRRSGCVYITFDFRCVSKNAQKKL
jgi:hypothetical protein